MSAPDLVPTGSGSVEVDEPIEDVSNRQFFFNDSDEESGIESEEDNESNINESE